MGSRRHVGGFTFIHTFSYCRGWAFCICLWVQTLFNYFQFYLNSNSLINSLYPDVRSVVHADFLTMLHPRCRTFICSRIINLECCGLGSILDSQTDEQAHHEAVLKSLFLPYYFLKNSKTSKSTVNSFSTSKLV